MVEVKGALPVEMKQALSVGEVAERSGIAVSTVHFYEGKGLISGWRTSGNQRRYARGVLRRVAIIRIAQRAGIPLGIVHDFLSQIPSDSPMTARDTRRITSAWKGILNERIVSLTQLRDQFDTCIGCGCLSLTECPLRNPEDTLRALGAGPHLLREQIP